MAVTVHPIPIDATRASWPYRLVGALLRPWLKIKTEPPDTAAALSPDGAPVCYMLERYGLSSALILEEACRAAGLPPPLLPMPGGHLRKSRALLALSRRDGALFRRPRSPTHSEGLSQLLAAVAADPALEVRLVPVSIFVGRAPTRTTGWFSVLFSENWVVVGRFRRLLAILFNGRDTIVHFSPATSLRAVVAEGLEPERTVRKAARVLRAHFSRIRAAVIGPDLSHRRTVVDGILNAPAVRQAIAASASKESLTFDQARDRARSYAWEIAADYSHPVVRSLSFVLTPFWNKIYDGITVHHFDTVKRVAPGHEVIYVPCHRSHIDYLLLSYHLYQSGIVPPHIAAGINLNLPVLGSILRRGGAFFLRRSFRANAVYSAVFSEYVSQLFARGVSMEYFIEGGRSRTGRLLEPRAGMLGMTVRSFLRQSRKPVVFQPVYIGYEKLIEGDSYSSELSGRPKEKESLLGLLRTFGILRNKYGKVALSFGEPIFLAEHLDLVAPTWREDIAAGVERPEWFAPAVATLADEILVHINEACDVNPINLLAIVLLSTPKHAIGESDLLASLALTKSLLERVPYAERVTVTALAPAEIVSYCERMGWITRRKHALGDVLSADEQHAVMLSYFRNNVLHLFATSAWVACCFHNNRRLRRGTVERLGEFVYPFLQNELFLPWSTEAYGERIQKTIDVFLDEGLIRSDNEGRMLRRRVGQTDEAFQLRVVSQMLTQAFERYYIAVALLSRNGPGTLSASELENLCHLTAQRLALLFERTAPEFFDRNLFRSFINTLKERKFVWLDDAGKLAFSDTLGVIAKDAKLILSRELRHSILKLTGLPRKDAPAELPAR
ncbi:MAG TPA: glycerol-3-phosphate 1-O-acyltransferase PlsB [Candidatus Saccharimonadia bacterium]|nr:glycerol-3-phosphate 1-O-acyltransferase PlsB [Candidatus Saccharimonadia bacterium]